MVLWEFRCVQNNEIDLNQLKENEECLVPFSSNGEWHEKVKTIKQMDESGEDSDRAYRQTAAVIWAGEKKTPFSLELLHLNQRHRKYTHKPKREDELSCTAANACAYIRNNQIYMSQRSAVRFCPSLLYIQLMSIRFWVSLFHRHQFYPFEILICTSVATFIYVDPSKVAIAIALLKSTHWICAMEKQAMPCHAMLCLAVIFQTTRTFIVMASRARERKTRNKELFQAEHK